MLLISPISGNVLSTEMKVAIESAIAPRYVLFMLSGAKDKIQQTAVSLSSDIS